MRQKQIENAHNLTMPANDKIPGRGRLLRVDTTCPQDVSDLVQYFAFALRNHQGNIYGVAQPRLLGFAPMGPPTNAAFTVKEARQPENVAVVCHDPSLNVPYYSRGHIIMQVQRGHFADYSKGDGLFGKYKGTYWREAHLRGAADEGVVVKGYAVKAGA